MTNLFLGIALYYNTNSNFVRIDVTNTDISHIYSLQTSQDLTDTNWCKSWIFTGQGVNTFYDYIYDTNRYYRAQDLGTNF